MAVEEKLGKAIMARRHKLLISQEEFARKAGITRSYMNSLENGKRIVSVAIVEKIAKALGITISELFRGL